MSYTAPLKDMQFVLHDVLKVTSSDVPGYSDLDAGFTSAVLDEAAKLATMDQLDYIVITTGRFDILAELVAESDDELLDIVSSQISELDRVVTTETFVYLRLEKQTYAWGVR